MPMFKRSRLSGAIGLGLFLPTGVMAAPEPDAMQELDTIQVESTTIHERTLDRRNEPSSVAVIGEDRVDESHIENIQQLLKSIPGITTEVQSGDSLKIHIRGVENQRFMGEKPGVAVVIDGVPVFERTGRVNIDLDNIESIRVIKGGASYLFGEDALSGAVVITTKRGADNAGFKIGTEAGSHGYRKGLARAGYSGDRLNTHVQVSRRQTDGYHYQSDYRTDYVNGKLQYLLDDYSDITLGFELSDREKDSHGTVTGVTQAAEDPRSYEGTDYARKFDVSLAKFFATYNRDLGDAGNLMVNVYQFGDNTDFVSAPQRYDAAGQPVDDPDAYTNDNDYRQVQRGIKSELRAGGGRLAWMAGLDLRVNQYENRRTNLVDYKSSPYSPVVHTAGTVTEDNETDEGVYAAYGEIKFRPVRDWLLTLNGRYDHIALDYSDHIAGLDLDKSFDVTSWRIGVNHDLRENMVLFANASTGFRTPTIEQLFAGTISPFGDTASNPDLDPEHAVNLELGLRGDTSVGGLPLAYEATVFQIQRDDYIMSVAGQYANPVDGVKDQYRNIGGMRSRGLELSVDSDTSRPWSFRLAYTFLDSEFTDYDNFNLALGDRWRNPTIAHYDNSGNKVPRTPRHHLNLGVTHRFNDRLRVTGELDVSSDYYADEMNLEKVDGHETFNLLANYRLKTGKGHWSLFARVDNVFDQQYYNTARGFYDSNADGAFDEEDLSIVVNPGRVWTAGVTLEF